MLDLLKDFITDLGGGAKTQALFGDNDYRVAAAALLIHVMTIDGSESAAERETLALLLQDRFGLDEEAAAALVAAATEADREAVDLYRFTSLINRSLDEDGRRRIIEMMWQIVFADGQVNEFEDNIVWRAADLLGISSRDRVNLRRDVAGQAGKPATQS